MGLPNDQSRQSFALLYRFSGQCVVLERSIELPLIMETQPQQSTIMANFFIVGTSLVYNAIPNRPTWNCLQVDMSTYHLIMKFFTPVRVSEVKGNQHKVTRCYALTIKQYISLEVVHKVETMLEWPKPIKSRPTLEVIDPKCQSGWRDGTSGKEKMSNECILNNEEANLLK